MKQEPKEHCSHNFEYSHTETNPVGLNHAFVPLPTAGTGGMFYKRVDVVVCTKCGEVRRK